MSALLPLDKFVFLHLLSFGYCVSVFFVFCLFSGLRTFLTSCRAFCDISQVTGSSKLPPSINLAFISSHLADFYVIQWPFLNKKEEFFFIIH